MQIRSISRETARQLLEHEQYLSDPLNDERGGGPPTEEEIDAYLAAYT